MQDLKKIIKKYENDYPELDYFNVQFTVLDAAGTKYPDVVIETCKSIMEATYKFIRKLLEDYQPTEKEERQSRVSEHASSVVKLLKDSKNFANSHFIRQSQNFTKQIAKIRNNQGDISHGRHIPKKKTSTVEEAEIIKKLCEAYAIYLLEETLIKKFGNRKIHAQQKNDKTEPLTESLKYEDVEEFNQWLDEQNPIDSVCYSQALYDQDYIAYYGKYENWREFVAYEDNDGETN